MASFINPYNFIPLGESTPVKKDKNIEYRGSNQNKLLTGWMNIDLLVKTPIIIPDGAHPKYYDLEKKMYVSKKNTNGIHTEYSALKMFNPSKGKQEFVIPGSEIRGLIRSTYETVTNSCVPFLMDDKPISQRVPLYGALTKRGLLNYDGKKWVLYSTEKKLEEVVILPVYEVEGEYYTEDFTKVWNNQKNIVKVNGAYKYAIMTTLKKIEESLENQEWFCKKSYDKGHTALSFEKNNPSAKKIRYGVTFERDGRKFNVLFEGKKLKNKADRKIAGYMFFKADGTVVKESNGTYVEELGWLQYNIPVDTSQVYHIAYLKKENEEPIYRWADSTARGDEYKKKKDPLYAEAYKKLLSALKRDGVGRNLNNSNEICNSALQATLEKACTDKETYVPVYYFIVTKKSINLDQKTGQAEVDKVVSSEDSPKDSLSNDQVQDSKDKINTDKTLVTDGINTVKDEDKIVYLSGSASGRIAQRRKWNEIMEGHTPCDRGGLCPACLLFGTVKDEGLKGHIRVSDAFLNDSEVHSTKHILPILSSPRTSAFEFYLKKPVEGATYWNFDFYGVTEYGEDGETYTKYYHLKKAMPRGRKMYWHHPLLPDIKEKNKMNSTLESIDKGVFSFKLFFDQITEEQLNDIIWVINLGENKPDSARQHKLGHAKPLGYGSVKLVVKDGMIREFSNDNATGLKYMTVPFEKKKVDYNAPIPSFNLQDETIKSLLVISDVNSANQIKVDYPHVDGKEAIYEWFSKNRTNPKSLQTLPNILDQNKHLT